MKVFKSDLIHIETDDSDNETTLNNESNNVRKPPLSVRVSQIITKPATTKRSYKPRKKPTNTRRKKYVQKQLQLPPIPPSPPSPSSPCPKSVPLIPSPPLEPEPSSVQVSAMSTPLGLEPTTTTVADPLQSALTALAASCERRVAKLENQLRLEEVRLIQEIKTSHQLRLTSYKEEIAVQLASACARMFPTNQ